MPPAQNLGGAFCGLFGTHVPFSDVRLSELYRNSGRYVSQVAKVNDSNVAAGYIVAVDGEISTSTAARSRIGR